MATIEKRTADNGEISYRVKVRLKGYPAQTSTHKRLTDAKYWAQQTEAAIREGRHFKTPEAKRHTFDDLLTRYYKEILPGYNEKERQVQQGDGWLCDTKSSFRRLLASGHTTCSVCNGKYGNAVKLSRSLCGAEAIVLASALRLRLRSASANIGFASA